MDSNQALVFHLWADALSRHSSGAKMPLKFSQVDLLSTISLEQKTDSRAGSVSPKYTSRLAAKRWSQSFQLHLYSPLAWSQTQSPLYPQMKEGSCVAWGWDLPVYSSS